MAMKTKYSAICCYFGTWPNYFQHWLDSCKTNTDVTFILVTDIPTESYRVPLNIIFEKKSFAEVQEKIRSKFSNLEVSIEKPYKLCCFKAAYGYIFDDLFQDYDYWGFFDIDTIWGNIVSFIPENKDNHLTKIFPCGHLSFIRNDEENRKPFEAIDTIVDRYPDGYVGIKIYPYK